MNVADNHTRAIPEQLANRHCLRMQKGKTDYRGQTGCSTLGVDFSAPLSAACVALRHFKSRFLQFSYRRKFLGECDE